MTLFSVNYLLRNFLSEFDAPDYKFDRVGFELLERL